MNPQPSGSPLLRQVSRSLFWNSVLLPIITVLNAILSVVIRRGFGLESGIYDILLGVLSSVLFYSSLGIPTSLQKFLPEREAAGGAAAMTALLYRTGLVRMAAIIACLVPLNLFAAPLADRLALGPRGAMLLHLLSALIVARGLFDLVAKALHASLAQLVLNLLLLAQAAIEPLLVAACLVLGYGIGGVIGAFTLSAGTLTLTGSLLLRTLLRRHSPAARAPEETAAEADPDLGALRLATPEARSLWRFAAFTYVLELSLYFASAAFAKPALAVVLGDYAPVALFSTGYYVAFMGVTMVVSAFRGVYRPMFARLRATGDAAQLRAAFSAVSKAQVAMLLPVGAGLGIMVEDYLPLLYGPTFAGAVPLARWFILLLFTETAFYVGMILLWTEESYRPVLAAQALLVLGVPLFLLAASRGGLTAAVITMGSLRAASSLIGFLAARRAYGVSFPWAFTGRVARITLVMSAAVMLGRSFWPTSWPEAICLTAAGALVFVLGIRLGRVFGAEETELLRRAQIPGGRWLLAWVS